MRYIFSELAYNAIRIVGFALIIVAAYGLIKLAGIILEAWR